MKSSQSNFNLRSPSSYLARSYLIATVTCIILKLLTYWSVKPIATYAPQFVHTILLNPKVQPICLPDKPVDYPDNREGDLVTITGWGLQKSKECERIGVCGTLKFRCSARSKFWLSLKKLGIF